MADVEAAPAEIDVDALDDKAFEQLKSDMRAEKPVEAQPRAKAPPAAKDTPQANEATTDADTGETDDDGGKTAETVPHGQFHRERERRKAAEAEREKLRSDYAKLMERTAQLLQPQEQANSEQAQADSYPAWDGPNGDPMAAGSWTQKEVLALKDKIEGKERAEQQRLQAEAQWQQVLTVANEQFSAAEKTDPTYRDAYNSLKQSYAAELKALGYQSTAIQAQLDQIEAQGIAYAVTNGIPVHEYVRNLATARGWRPKAPANDETTSEAAKIEQREQTRLASQSLGKAGGAVVNTGTITPEMLLDMSDEDFAAYRKKHGSVSAAFRQAS